MIPTADRWWTKAKGNNVGEFTNKYLKSEQPFCVPSGQVPAQVSAGNPGSSSHPFVLLLPFLKHPSLHREQEQRAKCPAGCNAAQQRQMRIHSNLGSHKASLPPLTLGQLVWCSFASHLGELVLLHQTLQRSGVSPNLNYSHICLQ